MVYRLVTFIIDARKFYFVTNDLITISGASTPKSGKKGMLSMVDNMLKLHTGTVPTNRKHAKRNQVRSRTDPINRQEKVLLLLMN